MSPWLLIVMLVLPSGEREHVAMPAASRQECQAMRSELLKAPLPARTVMQCFQRVQS